MAKKKRKPEPDELNFRVARSLDKLQIAVEAKATRAAVTLEEFILSQKTAGMAPAQIRSLLLRDLNEGGRIFGEFYRGLNLDVTGSLSEVANQSAHMEFGTEPEKKKVWICALVNTCPDCLPRHGEIDTFENWELRGLPASGWSVCRGNCQCQLLDAEDAEGKPELKEPLQRKRR